MAEVPTSSIRPPGSDEAAEIVKLDLKANTGEQEEARDKRESEQKSLYDDIRQAERVKAVEQFEETRKSESEGRAAVTFSDPTPPDANNSKVETGSKAPSSKK